MWHKRPTSIRRGVLFLAAATLVAPILTLTQVTSAQAFGTIGKFGQQTEHERITRAALACRPNTPSDGTCFEPRSLDQIAGRSGTFGAVGAPDTDEVFTPAAHCDDADHLTSPGYPRGRAEATRALQGCVSQLQGRFAAGVTAAAGTLKADGTVAPGESDLGKDCTFSLGVPGRDKCEAIEGLGRALHGVQDFYSHSNWTDRAAPDRPVGRTNPPGLDLAAPSPLLSLTGGRPLLASAVPDGLTTGCFSLVPLGCGKRVQHADLNKDTGTIDPATGATSGPTTPRGRTGGNFDRAVQGAVADTRRQWTDFRAALTDRYGKERGERIACVLTHDTPVRDCAPRG
ncbi:CinY protein [Streptomyces albireticuli]|uniref:CinY protein n=1 Tax=Streptomyces albireticuli TaxID=1940 RepID=UPI00367E2FA7